MDDDEQQLQYPYHYMLCDASSECNRTMSFKEWLNKRTTSQAASDSTKVQPSPAPQTPTGGGLLMIKDEPWDGPPGLSHDGHLSSAARDWIGPSSKRIQTHPPPNELPFSRGNPILHIKPNPRTKTSSPSPSQVQGLNLLPGTGMQTRSRSLLKRKAADNEQPEKPTDNGSKTRKSADNLLCHLCHVGCSGAVSMQQHLKGRHHKAKIKYMMMKTHTTTNAITPWGRQGGNPRCDLCGIWCSDVGALQMHFKGKKHKAKMQELQVCKETGGEKSSKAPIICGVCGVSCMNQDLFEQHLKGRQHAAKQELKRRGLL